MIHYYKGDLLAVKRGIIVHGCNAQGVMGSGVAKAVKEMYPGAFTQYSNDIMTNWAGLGDISVYTPVPNELIIVSAITQEFYGREPNTRYVSYDAIELCFARVFELAENVGLTVHIPYIGAGLAQGNWGIISTIIESLQGNITVKCWELESGNWNEYLHSK